MCHVPVQQCTLETCFVTAESRSPHYNKCDQSRGTNIFQIISQPSPDKISTIRAISFYLAARSNTEKREKAVFKGPGLCILLLKQKFYCSGSRKEFASQLSRTLSLKSGFKSIIVRRPSAMLDVVCIRGK